MDFDFDVNDLTIGQAKAFLLKAGEVQKLLGAQPSTQDNHQHQSNDGFIDHGFAVLAADRGHVWVGHITESDGYHHIKDAQAITRWGTTSGLNQIVRDGPTSSTSLGSMADVKVASKAVIHIAKTERSKWRS